MNGVLCCVAAMVLLAPADAATAAPQPDDPKELAAIRQFTALWLGKGPGGNIREVRFAGLPRDFDGAAAHLSGLHDVRLFSAGSLFTDAQLAAIRVWPTLEAVDLSDSFVTDKGAQYLTGMPKLEFLDLSGSKVTDAGVKQLAGIKALTGLKIGRTQITDKALAEIARLPHLEVLDVERTAVTDEGVRSLAGCKLTTLSLRDTKITNRGIELLKGMTTLRDLDVVSTRTTNDALVFLRGIRGLRVLGLPKVVVPAIPDDPKDVAALVAAGIRPIIDGNTGNVAAVSGDFAGPERGAWMVHLKGLHSLDSLGLPMATQDDDMVHLRGLVSLTELEVLPSSITDRGLANLAGLTNLRKLSLWNCRRITDAGMAHLAGLKKLETLDLRGVPIRGEGLRHLAGMTKLKLLWLDHSGVTDAGLAHMPPLQGLEILLLGGTTVTDAGLGHLHGLKKLVGVGPSPGITTEGLVRLKKYCPNLIPYVPPKRSR